MRKTQLKGHDDPSGKRLHKQGEGNHEVDRERNRRGMAEWSRNKDRLYKIDNRRLGILLE